MIIFVSNKEKMSYKISIVLDKRKIKQNNKYPVKLRVYCLVNTITTVKLFSLNTDLTTDEFTEIYINPDNIDLRSKKKDIRLSLLEYLTRANNIAKEMTIFNIDKFETKFFRKSSDKNNLKYYFDLIIDRNIEDKKIGTAESYKYTFNSLTKFSDTKKCIKAEQLTFNMITVDWLKQYQSFMLESDKSYTSIAIYTRTLRAVFNIAIQENDINSDIYPFGKDKYKIPRTKKVKKALNSKELKRLFDAVPTNDNEQQAKDFWFFSYTSNGMNFKDIALLKYSDIKDDKFSYYRAKTFDKSLEKTQIIIYLTDFTNAIIQKYGNKSKSGFVFDIIKMTDSSEIQYKKIKNFTRLINDHIKRIAKNNDLPTDISTYWARHSFATNSLRKGASMEFISEALNHSDLNVTKNYFAGFEDEAKKAFANSLLDF